MNEVEDVLILCGRMYASPKLFCREIAWDAKSTVAYSFNGRFQYSVSWNFHLNVHI
jgi:hypothetical protein